MWRSDLLLICTLCLAAINKCDEFSTEVLDNIRRFANSDKVVMHRMYPDTDHLYVDGRMYKIYDSDPTENPATLHVGFRSFKLYICVNCEFASWTRHELYAFVRSFPLLYDPRFYFVHNDIYEKDRPEKERHVNRIVQNVDYFIEILLNYAKINRYDASVETELLKTLLSLSLKLDFIKSLPDHVGRSDSDGVPAIGGSDDVILRLVLETVNAVQRFMALNCHFPSFYFGNDQAFGYSKNHTTPYDNDMRDFFAGIGPMRLLSAYHCSARQMLYLEIVPLFFGGAVWLTEHDRVSVDRVRSKIEQTHDLEIITWYQKNLFNTIMKLLFTQAYKLFAKMKFFPDNVMSCFKKLYSEVIIGVPRAPPALKKCLEYITNLSEAERRHNSGVYVTVLHKIDTYTSTLDEIVLATDTTPIYDTKSILDRLTYELGSPRSNFTCFVRLLPFLYNEDNKYYLPFATAVNDSETITMFIEGLRDNVQSNYERNDYRVDLTNDNNDQMELYEDGCEYIIGLYQLCFEAFLTVNLALSEYLDGEESYCQDISFYLNRVVEFLASHHQTSFFKSLYNAVIPLVEILGKPLFINRHLVDVKRVVFVLMTELNKCSFRFCKLPKYDYMLFKNIMFDKVGQYTDTCEDMTFNLYYSNVSEPFVQSVSKNLKEFYKAFDIRKTFFERYKYRIKFYWKDEQLDIVEIHKHITYGVRSYFYLYAFFDYYFKVSIAIIYFELKFILNIIPQTFVHENVERRTFTNEICDGFRNIFGDLLVESFPGYFNDILIDINKYANIVLVYYCAANDDMRPLGFFQLLEIEKRLNDQFDELRVVLDFDKPEPSVNFTPKVVRNKTEPTKLKRLIKICHGIWYAVYFVKVASQRSASVVYSNPKILIMAPKLPYFCTTSRVPRFLDMLQPEF